MFKVSPDYKWWWLQCHGYCYLLSTSLPCSSGCPAYSSLSESRPGPTLRAPTLPADFYQQRPDCGPSLGWVIPDNRSGRSLLSRFLKSPLSPHLIQAVAEALRGLNGNQPPSPPSPPRPVESSASPAQYQFEYKIANDRTQTYIFQEESRDGLEVVGRYGYVDPTGALITVRHERGSIYLHKSYLWKDQYLEITKYPVVLP